MVNNDGQLFVRISGTGSGFVCGRVPFTVPQDEQMSKSFVSPLLQYGVIVNTDEAIRRILENQRIIAQRSA